MKKLRCTEFKSRGKPQGRVAGQSVPESIFATRAFIGNDVDLNGDPAHGESGVSHQHVTSDFPQRSTKGSIIIGMLESSDSMGTILNESGILAAPFFPKPTTVGNDVNAKALVTGIEFKSGCIAVGHLGAPWGGNVDSEHGEDILDAMQFSFDFRP